MSIVRKESNCHRKKRPRPTTSGKIVLAVIPISSARNWRALLLQLPSMITLPTDLDSSEAMVGSLGRLLVFSFRFQGFHPK